MLHTPLNLEILIHFHCIAAPFPRRGAPAVEDGIKYLVANGLLDRADYPHVTDKGQFMLQHLLSVPFPVQRWEIPDVHQSHSDHTRDGS